VNVERQSKFEPGTATWSTVELKRTSNFFQTPPHSIEPFTRAVTSPLSRIKALAIIFDNQVQVCLFEA